MSIKLVVFDIAGTTIQDEIGVMNAFRETLKNHGYEVPINEVALVMGYKKIEAIQILLKSAPDQSKITEELINEIHGDFVKHMISFYRDSAEIQVFPHTEETFKKLHEQGIKVGLNTGFTRAIADTIINRLHWQEKGLIDYLIASDEVESGRPHPYMIQKMMKEFGITDSSEVAKVGDTEVDINEGRNAGCKYVIGVTTGSFTREALEPYQPTHIIDDIAEVLTIINE
ncbi:HAD-IA family hydrolase [Mucilaginibacter sp. L196]|uniref:HAD-IA family hydrolase n=1 Tax=Mucilaginibacter sp. L196 TaxID=1641870 RepID=UPI00131C8B99|nr:HAD-IA family hydrolase [Mucilaginibacter sp. L196]